MEAASNAIHGTGTDPDPDNEKQPGSRAFALPIAVIAVVIFLIAAIPFWPKAKASNAPAASACVASLNEICPNQLFLDQVDKITKLATENDRLRSKKAFVSITSQLDENTHLANGIWDDLMRATMAPGSGVPSNYTWSWAKRKFVLDPSKPVPDKAAAADAK